MPKTRSQSNVSKPLLYCVVFDAVVVKCLVASLFIFFLLHPALPVFASELPPEEPAEQSEENSSEPNSEMAQEEDSTVTEVSTKAADIEEGEAIETQVPAENENEAFKNEADVAEDISSDVILDLDDGETEDVAGAVNVEPTSSSTKASTSVPAVENSTPAVNATSTAPVSEDAPPLTVSTTTATTSVPSEPVVEDFPTSEETPAVPNTDEDEEEIVDDEGDKNETPVETIVYVPMEITSDSNRHVFSTDECVGVGNGSYYCYETSSETGVIADDGAYAAPDDDGDFEIFLSLDGETLQLTHNTHDDRAPYYDATADEVVFHRLIDGRYQIFSYDLEKESETQLTSTQANSMEPTQSDGVTVWQEWVDNNWEIAALIDNEIIILSNSEHNDIAPSVKDGYVMWHTLSAAGEKVLSVYEISTGITSHVTDPDGGQVSNPRFVLVYDTTFDNGDTVTKTYDPETGAIEPIGNKPWQDKQSIPEPEPVGESSAMINTKPATRDGGREDSDVNNGGPEPVSGNGLTSTSSTIAEPTGNSSASTNQDINLNATTSEPFSLTEFDLVVVPYGTSSSAQQNYSASTSDSVE